MERGSPHIWFSNAMLKPHRGDLKEREWRIRPLGPGKGRGVGCARDCHRRGGSHQASPNFRKAWAVTQVAGHLCSGRIDFLHMEEAARRAREPPLRAGGGDTDIAGRGTKQQEDKDSGLGRAHHDTVQSGCPGESSVRESGKGAG